MTLDFLQKMLSVHERLKSGMPVIISGETGVGKTFLFETMSKLYSKSHVDEFMKWRADFLKKHLPNCDSVEDISELSLYVLNETMKKLSGELKHEISKYLSYLETPLKFPDPVSYSL